MNSIVVEEIVAGTPEEVFDRWVTPSEVAKFFAPKSVIEPRVGGEYAMIFEPELDPEGLSYGTRGCRILAFERGRKLAFSWIPFIGKEIEGAESAPPSIDPAERTVSTSVELNFTPEGDGRTRLVLTHYGFRTGGKWEEAYHYFARVWPAVLAGLR